ncbi:MAG: hypothetical protein N2Z73_04995 [Endomicrobia bacterium]|nr:hypothetical protein [Endomicrobiia bacterium]
MQYTKKLKVICFLLVFLLFDFFILFADLPPGINYQGRYEEAGQPVTGTRTFRFNLYNAATGGTLLWSSGDVNINVVDGLFNYVLNCGGIDWRSNDVYLEITVEGTTLSPRERVQASAYAFYSSSASYAFRGGSGGLSVDISGSGTTNRVAKFTAGTTVGNSNITDDGTNITLSGNVGIGTTSPLAELHLAGSDNTPQLLIRPNAMSANDISQIRFADPDGGTGPMSIEYRDDGSPDLAIMGGRVGIGIHASGTAMLEINPAGTQAAPGGWRWGIHFATPTHSAITLFNPTAGGLLFGIHGINQRFYFGRYNTDNTFDKYFAHIGATDPTLEVGGTFRATATTGHRLGDSTDTGRALSILNSGLTAGSAYYLTLGKANNTNNQAEISYYHAGDGSADNELRLGLYGVPDVVRIQPDSVYATKNFHVQHTANPGIEIRDTDGGTPYIDFSNDASADYDGRFILSGDDTLGIQGVNLSVFKPGSTASRIIIQQASEGTVDIGVLRSYDGSAHRSLQIENDSTIDPAYYETAGALNVRSHLFVNGNIVKSGSVSFIRPHPKDPTKEIIYVSLEGPECGMYVRGSGQLVNGEAVIELPEHFSLLASAERLTAHVTARGETEWWLYVKELTKERLVVKEAKGGRSNVSFDYIVFSVLDDKKDYNPVQDVIREERFGSAEEVRRLKEKVKRGEIDIDDLRPPELRFKKGYISPFERMQMEKNKQQG